MPNLGAKRESGSSVTSGLQIHDQKGRIQPSKTHKNRCLHAIVLLNFLRSNQKKLYRAIFQLRGCIVLFACLAKSHICEKRTFLIEDNDNLSFFSPIGGSLFFLKDGPTRNTSCPHRSCSMLHCSTCNLLLLRGCSNERLQELPKWMVRQTSRQCGGAGHRGTSNF